MNILNITLATIMTINLGLSLLTKEPLAIGGWVVALLLLIPTLKKS